MKDKSGLRDIGARLTNNRRNQKRLRCKKHRKELYLSFKEWVCRACNRGLRDYEIDFPEQ